VLSVFLYAWYRLVDMVHNSQGLGCSRVQHCVESKWFLIKMEWNHVSPNSVTIVLETTTCFRLNDLVHCKMVFSHTRAVNSMVRFSLIKRSLLLF